MKVPKARKLKSGNWFIQLRLGGESIPVTARTEKGCTRQAQFVKAEYMAGKRENPPVADSDAAKLPALGDAIDAYIANRDAVLSPSTIRGYKTIRKTRFTNMMDQSLSNISDDEWQTVRNAEAKLCSAKTLKNAWGFIAPVLLDATGKQPPRVTLPQIMQNERPFLEPEQIRPFIEAVHGTAVEIPALLALSSLRRSEIMALRWENIDLKNRTIKVKRAAVFNSENKLEHKPENKNSSSARMIPIMIDELYEAMSWNSKSSGFVVECNPNTIWSDYQTMRKIYTHIAKSDISKYTEKFKCFFSPDGNQA